MTNDQMIIFLSVFGTISLLIAYFLTSKIGKWEKKTH